MIRRNFLRAFPTVFAVAMLGTWPLSAIAKLTHETITEMQARWREFFSPAAKFPGATPAIDRTAEDWAERLPRAAFKILFEEDTEPTFSSALNDEKRPGVYACKACNLPLFTSEMKYDSRTGWPSFFTHIPEHLGTKTDFKLVWPRTEYHCVKCGGHQGHLFDDGPAPTNERWCNNGLALTFITRDNES